MPDWLTIGLAAVVGMVVMAVCVVADAWRLPGDDPDPTPAPSPSPGQWDDLLARAEVWLCSPPQPGDDLHVTDVDLVSKLRLALRTVLADNERLRDRIVVEQGAVQDAYEDGYKRIAALRAEARNGVVPVGTPDIPTPIPIADARPVAEARAAAPQPLATGQTLVLPEGHHHSKVVVPGPVPVPPGTEFTVYLRGEGTS